MPRTGPGTTLATACRGLQYIKGARMRRWCVVCCMDEGAQPVQEIGGVEALKGQLHDFMGRVGMEVVSQRTQGSHLPAVSVR